MPGSGLKCFSRLSHLSNQQFYEERPHDSYLADRKVISRNLGAFSRITHVLSGGSGIWAQASLAHSTSKEFPITGHSHHSVRTLQHKPLSGSHFQSVKLAPMMKPTSFLCGWRNQATERLNVLPMVSLSCVSQDCVLVPGLVPLHDTPPTLHPNYQPLQLHSSGARSAWDF